MYSPPPAVIVPVAAPKRNGLLSSAPCIAVACILFLLLLLAATIILSLIPVYTPRRNSASATSTTPTYYVVLTYNGTAGSDGPLSQTNLNAIARALERARGVPTGSIVVQSGATVSNAPGTGKRKRRAEVAARSRRGIFTVGGTTLEQRIYLQIAFILAICPTCLNNLVKAFTSLQLVVTLIINGVSIALILTILSIGRGIATTPVPLFTTLAPNTTVASATGPTG